MSRYKGNRAVITRCITILANSLKQHVYFNYGLSMAAQASIIVSCLLHYLSNQYVFNQYLNFQESEDQDKFVLFIDSFRETVLFAQMSEKYC